MLYLRHSLTWLLVGLPAALAACSASSVVRETSAGSSGAGGGGTTGTAEAAGSGGSNVGCGATHGPMMVRVPLSDGGAFCIDSTEVTNGHYAEFLDAAVPAETQAQVCSWNASFAPPPGWWPVPDLEKPVVTVNWCDAVAFCAWAGKRLCGAIGGGPLSQATLTDPMTSQWTYACTAGGARLYPYGDAFSKAACVTDQPLFHETGPSPVGATPGCVGGFPGLHDMSGNVLEFQDYSEGDAGRLDLVATLGGSYGSIGAQQSACASLVTFPRFAQTGASGFRCCKDLP